MNQAVSNIFFLFVLLRVACTLPQCRAQDKVSGSAAEHLVTLTETATDYTLANGSIVATIEKRSGSFSLKYNGLEAVQRGYWSPVTHSPAGEARQLGALMANAVRIDPARNGGERAEISLRFAYDGKPASVPADVEARYTLGRDDSGLYLCAVWTHQPGQPAMQVELSHFVAKLNLEAFDFLAVDAQRFKKMASPSDWDHGQELSPKEARRLTTGIYAGQVEHKYDYSAIIAETPAFGWISTARRTGVWMINPSAEYISGGLTDVELTGHLDGNPGGRPTLLNIWHGSHYGLDELSVDSAEAWTKVYGPFLIYCNAGSDQPEALWKDALAKADAEKRAWPYAWERDPNYPPANARGSVSGSIALNDPQAPGASPMRNLRVGLATPPYPAHDDPRNNYPPLADWQRDGKYYQFWTHADDASGAFAIRNVRPGDYTLYAYADGVLGEFSRANVTVKASGALDLGKLVWTPVRYGKQLWEIGVPNRSAEEFRHGDHYWQWGLFNAYPKEFPDGVNYIIGKSDWRRDWNYAQAPVVGENGEVQDSPWSITFDVSEKLSGKATLRLAIAGSRNPRGIEALLNDQPIGKTGPLPDTGVMHRDGIRGYWCERDLTFDAALLKPGANVIKLRASANNWVNGVLYDYLRLEVSPSVSSMSNNRPQSQTIRIDSLQTHTLMLMRSAARPFRHLPSP